MSVIPQEDNLVMSFAEATRVFNNDQSNTGSFVPGTGDAGVQAPNSSGVAGVQRNSSSYYGGGSTVGPPLLARASQSQAPTRPYQGAEGTAAVVPPTLPSREQIANNPEAMVSVRAPAVMTPADEEEEHCESVRRSPLSRPRELI